MCSTTRRISRLDVVDDLDLRRIPSDITTLSPNFRSVGLCLGATLLVGELVFDHSLPHALCILDFVDHVLVAEAVVGVTDDTEGDDQRHDGNDRQNPQRTPFVRAGA